METANYNYTVEQSGDSSIITYKKTKISYKAMLPTLVVGFFPAGFLTYLMASYNDTVTSIIVKFIFSLLLISFGLVFIINQFRKTGQITIGRNSLSVNGKNYDRNHIKSIFVKTPTGEELTTIVVRHNLGSALGQLNTESHNAFKRHLKDGAYRICIRYGSKDITIAKHLSEIHSEVLFDKITEIIDFKKQ